ncbi:MAG TPA: SPOR domain-containing protein [Bacteroidia bacterium]|nr:SPOR domain-containing protein [Bacteroidia bacterium]
MLIGIKNIFLFIVFILVFAVNSVAQTNTDTTTNPPRLGDVFKPTIGFGAGTLSYFGNIYSKGHQLQSLTQSRIGFDLNLSQPLTKSLYLNFYVMFGKLGANERSATPSLNQNFQSQINLGGVQLMYDFSNFIKKQTNIRPYVLTGFEGFEFLSKTDMYDKHGNKYYYWSDGTIKNMAQGSVGSQNATTLVRDYTYDSDVRELNKNGYGKYRESSWAIPVGAGFTMNAGEHIKFRMGATMHFAFTNHIDGVGSAKNDKFLMFAASVHYDLVTRKGAGGLDTLPSNHYDGIDFLAIDNGDEDGDGVKDFDDLCHGTPAGAKVDVHGCPIDEDKDLVADYRDEELPTDTGKVANDKGIAMTDEDHQDWYNRYYDSTGQFSKVVDLGGPVVNGKAPIVDTKKSQKDYTVELVRYKGGIPPDEMAYLLSIGDIRSFNYNDTTVVYAAGSYADVRKAVKRRDEYIGEGLKSSAVGYFKGEVYTSLSEAELEKEIAEANKKGAVDNSSSANESAAVNKGIIYRVQLGAYRNKLSPTMFKHAGKVIELKTEDGLYKYASGSYKTLADAAVYKAELVYEGYEDAFITAYEKGKRVSLSKAGATYEDKNYKENLNENANNVSAVDKSLVNFKVQLGALKKMDDTSLDEQLKELKDVDKEPTPSGLMRITAGEFKDYNEAVKYKNTLAEKGIVGAFVIGTFKGQVISIQEALDLLK